MSEPISSAFDMTRELLGVVGKILDKLPTYSQKKKEKYYKLVRKFDIEMSRNYDNRDDNQVGLAKMELERFVQVFSSEIETSLKAEWSE